MRVETGFGFGAFLESYYYWSAAQPRRQHHICQIRLSPFLTVIDRPVVKDNYDDVVDRNVFFFHLFHFSLKLLLKVIRSNAPLPALLSMSSGKNAS